MIAKRKNRAGQIAPDSALHFRTLSPKVPLLSRWSASDRTTPRSPRTGSCRVHARCRWHESFLGIVKVMTEKNTPIPARRVELDEMAWPVRQPEAIGGYSVKTSDAKFGRPRIPRLRERVLESAEKLFAEKGFERASIDEIAARARVGKGSVYRLFASKEELYIATVIQGYSDLSAAVAEKMLRAHSLSGSLTTFVREIVSYFSNRLDFFEMLRSTNKLPRTYRERYHDEREKLVRIAGQIIEEGARRGLLRTDLRPELLVESLFGMIRGVQRARGNGFSIADEEVVRTITSVFLEGCSSRRSSLPKTSELT
jgi:TetR/AcrR family transcriptional regulator